ncbi:MAG: hypothetical protein V8R49_05535, partial [Duodenibacillus massiliensis]
RKKSMMTEDKEEITPVGKRQYKRGTRTPLGHSDGGGDELLRNPKPGRFTTKEIAARAWIGSVPVPALQQQGGGFDESDRVLRNIRDWHEAFSELDAVEGLTYTQRATAKVRALLEFAEKNPGLTRLMTGEALVFEEDRVQQYMTHVISKAETSVV